MNVEKLPRLLKEPTGWVMLVLVIGFFYVQWPTRVRVPEQPNYYNQTLDNGFTVRWEQKPSAETKGSLQLWDLSRKGMSFLVQTDTLNEPFDTLVQSFVKQDQKAVGGAVQEPLEMGETVATYAFFDAENRIQKHQVYVRDGRWIKVSVLYKPSMESRVKRADEFMASIGFHD